MKYNRIISAAAALLFLAGAASCGKTDSSDADSIPKGIDSSEIVTSGSSSEATSEDIPGEESSSSATIVKTTVSTEKKGTASTTTAKAHHAGGNSLAPSGSSQKTTVGSNNSGGGGNSVSGGGTAEIPTTQRPSSGGASSGGTQQPASHNPTEAPAPEEAYTAEIVLGGTPEITGSNVTVDGSVITVNAGGEYRFTGILSDGQICVNTVTEEKVTIVLDGVDIHNSSGPAIFINEAKKCTIKVRDGSVNNLSDETKNKALDGVIYSNDTLRIKGGGVLNINAGNAHGICSDDDIIIENGKIDIKSKKSGLIANDDITVSGGDIVISGGTNGIKSKGTVHISGGHSVIAGGTKEEKCSIYAAGAFDYSGGWLFAAGNQVYAPTSSVNPYVIAAFSSAVPGGTSVEMILDDVQMISFEPHCSFRSLLMLAPEISEGSSFYTIIGDGSSEIFTISGEKNIFEVS